MGVQEDVTGSNNNGPIELPEFTPPESDVILGQVVALGGRPLEGVTVEIPEIGTAVTDHEGRYFLAQVPASPVVVHFARDGYLGTSRALTLTGGGSATVNVVLIQKAAAVSLDASAGGAIVTSRGGVSLPASAVVDGNGQVVTGQINVRISAIDVSGPEIAAAPGDFTAITSSQEPVMLETFGMADFELSDGEGNLLQIKEGEKAGIEILLPQDTTLQEGDVVPAWYFDQASGKWLEEGSGTVAVWSQDPTRLVFTAEVAHFSWWNADDPYETSCVSGQVLDCDGTPAAYATIRASGISYDGDTSAHADGTGGYCVLVKKGAEVSVYASKGVGGDRRIGGVQVSAPDAPAQCGGNCASGNIQLSCDGTGGPDCDETYFASCHSCLTGRVVDEDGTPQGGVRVDVKTGKTGFVLVTEADGSFCSPAAMGSITSFTARSSSNSVGVASFTATQAGVCPSCEEIPDVVLQSADSSGDEPIDLTGCAEAIGGLTIDQILINGAAPEILEINDGWIEVLPPSEQGGGWRLNMYLLPSDVEGGLVGRPAAQFSMYSESTPTAGTHSFPLPDDQDVNAWLMSNVGSMFGLGNEKYSMGGYGSSWDSGAGFIRFDQAFSKVGDPVKGGFELVMDAECGVQGATVTIRGTFDSVVMDPTLSFIPPTYDTESVEWKKWECDLLGSLAFLVAAWDMFQSGSVQVDLDGSPMPMDPDSFTSTGRYSWTDDRLSFSIYGLDGTVNFQVDEPKAGVNPVTSGSFYGAGDSCFYQVATGQVDLPQWSGPQSSGWMTGGFDITFEKNATMSEGDCPSHQVTGQFGAPVCR